MIISEFDIQDIVGAGALLFALFTYCIVRRVIAVVETPGRLRCNARLCILCGIVEIGTGIFEITWFEVTWWGWILILLGVFLILRGNKFRNEASNISAGYQSFDHNINSSDNPQSERRLSGPQIIIVNENDINKLSHSIYSSSNALQEPIVAAQSVIRNAVPPSPFSGTQGNDPYIVPSIPMVTSYNTPRSGSNTPRIARTMGNVATSNYDVIETQNDEDAAEDSIYVENEKEEEEEEDKDEDDGKNEIDCYRDMETPSGPSEGNVTFS